MNVLTMLRGDIIAHEGLWNEAHIRRNIQQGSTLRVVNVSEEPDGLPRYVGSTPEVDLKHSPGNVLRGPLNFADEAITSVIEDEVDATNFSFYVFQRGIDILAFGNVKLKDDQLVFGPLRTESVQGGGGTKGRDRDIALAEDELGHAAAKAGRGTGDCSK